MVEKDQHFLKDKRVVRRIRELLELDGGEVVEIGAGKGSITRELVREAKVIAVEKDGEMADRLAKLRHVEVIPADGVRAVRRLKFRKICGNLPFSILEPFFRELDGKVFAIGVFIVGRQFPEKIAKIAPGLEVVSVEGVCRDAFEPRPKRDAALVVVRPRGVSS